MAKWRKMKPPTMAEKKVEKMWKNNVLSQLWRKCSCHEGVVLDLTMEDDMMVECLRNAFGPNERVEVETSVGIFFTGVVWVGE